MEEDGKGEGSLAFSIPRAEDYGSLEELAAGGLRTVTTIPNVVRRTTPNNTKKWVCSFVPRKFTWDTWKTFQVRPKTQQRLKTEFVGHNSILTFSQQRKRESLGNQMYEYRIWVIRVLQEWFLAEWLEENDNNTTNHTVNAYASPESSLVWTGFRTCKFRHL